MSIQTLNKRNDNIDFIRGISILLVILLHIYIRVPYLEHLQSNSFLNALKTIVLQSGYYGVIIFFVISGFLITDISIKRWNTLKTIELKQFYYLRFARIFPMLITVVVILSLLDLFAVNGFVIHTTSLKEAVFAALTFHINWLEAKTGYLPGSWDVMWSLSVEEVFYLFFPLLFLFVRNKYAIGFILLIIIVLGPFARVFFSNNDIWSDHSYLSCMDGIVFGCLAALMINTFRLNFLLIKICFTVGLSLFILIFLFRQFVYDIGLCNLGLNITLLEISIALLLIFSKSNLQTYSKKWKMITLPFRWYGKNSYEVYLTHMFIVTVFFNFAPAFWLSSPIKIGCLFIAIVLLAGLLGNIIEKIFSAPMNHFLRRIATLKNDDKVVISI